LARFLAVAFLPLNKKRAEKKFLRPQIYLP